MRTILSFLVFVFILQVFFIKLDGLSVLAYVEVHGVKSTVERIWNGPTKNNN